MAGQEPDALTHCVRLLARRDYTENQLRERLERAGFDAGDSQRALELLTADGYVNDAQYAQRFVEDKRALSGWGHQRIARRLREVGVAPALVERALAAGEHDEMEAAVVLLRSRMAPPRDDRERRRAHGLLLRRGYDSELAYAAVRALERES